MRMLKQDRVRWYREAERELAVETYRKNIGLH
jgi:hypothetical protein